MQYIMHSQTEFHRNVQRDENVIIGMLYFAAMSMLDETAIGVCNYVAGSGMNGQWKLCVAIGHFQARISSCTEQSNIASKYANQLGSKLSLVKAKPFNFLSFLTKLEGTVDAQRTRCKTPYLFHQIISQWQIMKMNEPDIQIELFLLIFLSQNFETRVENTKITSPNKGTIDLKSSHKTT